MSKRIDLDWSDIPPDENENVIAGDLLYDAAPDLLEALEDLRKELRDNPDVKIMTHSLPADIGMTAAIRKADAAIAKAKGEGGNV